MLPVSNVTSPTSCLSRGSVFLYLCWKRHQHSHVFPVKNRGPHFSAPEPEHILLSPRAAILGTLSQQRQRWRLPQRRHRTGPDGPINALKKKKKKASIKPTSVLVESRAEMRDCPGNPAVKIPSLQCKKRRSHPSSRN